MESRLSGRDMAFDGAPDSDEDGHDYTPAAYLQDERFEPLAELERRDTEQQNHRQLHQALSDLDERSRDIVASRWLTDDKVTLQVLAEKYSVSAERIRQLEKNAMKKLQVVLTA
jgi:RNA polymerase sigma-32 factor